MQQYCYLRVYGPGTQKYFKRAQTIETIYFQGYLKKITITSKTQLENNHKQSRAQPPCNTQPC